MSKLRVSKLACSLVFSRCWSTKLERVRCHCHRLGGGRKLVLLLRHHLGRQSCQTRALDVTRPGTASCDRFCHETRVSFMASHSPLRLVLAHWKCQINCDQGEGIDDSMCKSLWPLGSHHWDHISWLNSPKVRAVLV